MAPGELLETVQQYCRQPAMKGTTVAQLCSDTGFGRTQVEKVVSTLRGLEAEAGEVESKKMVLTGNIEVDAAAVKKV